MLECVDTQSWGDWLSEVIIGIENPNEDIAANYIRQTAIEFCKKAYVLQRVITLCHRCDNTYTLPTWPEEQLWYPLAVGIENYGCFIFDCCSREIPVQFDWDLRNGEVSVINRHHCIVGRHHPMIKVWIAVAPTEDALYHDQFLYEKFRRPIAEQARAVYARAVHFRDAALMRNIQRVEAWQQDIKTARKDAVYVFSSMQNNRRNFSPL